MQAAHAAGSSCKTAATPTDSFSLLNMQISPVAPTWHVLRWKSTDTSICLVRWRKEGDGACIVGKKKGYKQKGESRRVDKLGQSHISSCGWYVLCNYPKHVFVDSFFVLVPFYECCRTFSFHDISSTWELLRSFVPLLHWQNCVSPFFTHTHLNAAHLHITS